MAPRDSQKPETGDTPAITVRTLGLLCPLPIIKTARALRDVPTGSIIEVLSDDPGFLEDMPAWCGETGHELIRLVTEDGIFRARIRKTKDT